MPTERIDTRIKYDEGTLSPIVDYLVHHTYHLYFHGYRLSDILTNNFFPRFCQFTQYGLCYMLSGLMMLAFRDDPTSRIVRGYYDDGRLRHSWMEFCLNDKWWVIDLCWFTPCLLDRDDFYAQVQPEVYYICDHDEFWRYPVSSQLEQKMRDPATSYIFYEVLDIYSYYPDCDCAFHPHIETKLFDEKAGRGMSVGLIIEYPMIMFSQRIMNEFMLDEERTAPKAHTVRKVRYFQKKIRESYARFVKECQATAAN